MITRRPETGPMKPWQIKRNLRHQHNGFFGSTRMAQVQMLAIINSRTATDDAKRVALKIAELLAELGNALKTRVDQ